MREWNCIYYVIIKTCKVGMEEMKRIAFRWALEEVQVALR